MEIRPLEKNNKHHVLQAANLLAESFPEAYADCAEEEIRSCLEDEKIALAATDDNRLIGFAGAVPQYGTTGWELHPIVIDEAYRYKGIGTILIKALEELAAFRGCITMYLGTDDEYGRTSLSNTDLYMDTWNKIDKIKNTGSHPFEFYQKMGYRIVGVIPDANGFGKPDIIMAKRILENQ